MLSPVLVQRERCRADMIHAGDKLIDRERLNRRKLRFRAVQQCCPAPTAALPAERASFRERRRAYSRSTTPLNNRQPDLPLRGSQTAVQTDRDTRPDARQCRSCAAESG